MKSAKITFISITTLSMLFLYMQICLSAPNEMNFQGRLLDSSGFPVSDGIYTMVFSIYDGENSGSSIWAEVQDVDVANGLYSVIFGQGTLLGGALDAALFSGDDRWLGINVGNDVLLPRLKLTSVAYALQAQEATSVANGSVTTIMLEDLAVDEAKLADGAVTSLKIEDGAITNDDLGPNIDADTLDGKTLTQIHAEETDPTVNPDVNDGVSWTELGSVPEGFADGIDNDSGGDITAVNTSATSGLSGGAESGDATLQVNFAGTGDSTTVSRSNHNHDATYFTQTQVDDIIGALLNTVNNLQGRIGGLESRLQYLTLEMGELNGMPGPHVIIEGANFHVRSGSGTTYSPVNGLGNLIVGYNEDRDYSSCSLGSAYPDQASCETAGGQWWMNNKTGSHNLVVGTQHNYNRFGGIVAGEENTISGDFSSVSGGYNNTASGNRSSVSGGLLNTASGGSSSVSGGRDNHAHANYSAILGGDKNTTGKSWGEDHGVGEHSTVSGGSRQLVYGDGASASGGDNNQVSGDYASVSGGHTNSATDLFSSVSGGAQNDAMGYAASVSGGKENVAYADYSSIMGGASNLAGDESIVYDYPGGWIGLSAGNHAIGRYATVSGGAFNKASGRYSSVSGGGGGMPYHGNVAYAAYSSILGGEQNTTGTPARTEGLGMTVSGGYGNAAIADASTVSGGRNNEASGDYSSVSGGRYNRTKGDYSSVSGGGSDIPDYGNAAYANYSSILGGIYNITGNPYDNTVGERSTISGGDTNIAIGTSSTVSGGHLNTASGERSTLSGGGSLSIGTVQGYRSPLGTHTP